MGVHIEDILDMKAYENISNSVLNNKIETAESYRNQDVSGHIDRTVGTVTLSIQQELDCKLMDTFLQDLLWEKKIKNLQSQTMEIFRLKGVVALPGESRRQLLQAVHELWDQRFSTPWEEDEERKSTLVFIGRYLDKSVLYEHIQKCIAS